MSEFKIFKDWLKNSNFLTDKDCELFEPFLQIMKIKSKEFFIKESKICSQIGFVNKGCFRMYYLMDGKEVNTQFIFENHFVVDYDSFIQNKPSRFYIQALEDAEIVTFNLTALENAYKVSKNWEKFGRLMAEDAYKCSTERVESFLFLNGEQRYLKLVKEEPEIINRIPLYLIASYLGLERESLSRLRKNIVKK